jgi:soluble lytic murein transglycosylase-like protein
MYESIIAAASETYAVPVPWIQAVIGTESSWKADAYRYEASIKDASYGLMQLLSTTAKALGYSGTPEGLYDPETNINLGTKLLSQLRTRYGDNFSRVYSAYNSGNPDKYLTSSQVGSNVSRALTWLEKYASEAAGAVVQSTSPEGVLLVGFMVVLLMYAWSGKRR